MFLCLYAKRITVETETGIWLFDSSMSAHSRGNCFGQSADTETLAADAKRVFVFEFSYFMII